jgi:hypothetical protein
MTRAIVGSSPPESVPEFIQGECPDLIGAGGLGVSHIPVVSLSKDSTFFPLSRPAGEGD